MNAGTLYDQYWANGLHVSPEWGEKTFRKVSGPLIGRERVLDYGCGLGYGYQRLLAGSVKSYAGADVGSVALNDLRRKGFAAYQIDPDKGTIECADASFDGAICSEVFEHLFNPLQSARELHRVLKPGGVLVATVPNFGYHAWRLMALLRAQVPSEPEDPQKNRYNGVHIRYFSALMFKRLLRDAGFDNVAIGSFDEASIWDVTRCAGPFAAISDFANRHLPGPFHLRFLQDVWPNVFAKRLSARAYRPQDGR
jgi:SAM-dependent methyltransferase